MNVDIYELDKQKYEKNLLEIYNEFNCCYPVVWFSTLAAVWI